MTKAETANKAKDSNNKKDKGTSEKKTKTATQKQVSRPSGEPKSNDTDKHDKDTE